MNFVSVFSEFVGTLVLVLLGNGVCAATSLKRMNANQSGRWVCIILGWGFAVLAGATVSSAMGGAGHLNPAVTLMQAIMASRSDAYSIGLTYFAFNGSSITAESITAVFFLSVIFQFLGAIVGQSVLNFINFKFIQDKENELTTIRGFHCTAPSYKNKEDKAAIFNVSYEFVGTAVLLGFILCTVAFNNGTSGTFGTLGAIPVAFIIMSIGLSLGSATGYAVNPARDLGPRIAFAIWTLFVRKEDRVKGICDWGYSWVPVVGPMAAGIVIGLFGLIPFVA